MQIPFHSKPTVSKRAHTHMRKGIFSYPSGAVECKIVSVGVLLTSGRMKLPFMLHISSKKILLQVIQKVSMNDSQKVLKVNMGSVSAAKHPI